MVDVESQEERSAKDACMHIKIKKPEIKWIKLIAVSCGKTDEELFGHANLLEISNVNVMIQKTKRQMHIWIKMEYIIQGKTKKTGIL